MLHAAMRHICSGELKVIHSWAFLLSACLRVHGSLIDDAENEYLMLDTPLVRVRQQADWGDRV
jgi:hypothetical protein